ncbi:MAG: replication protein [Bacteroidota bacterium]
MEQRTKEPFLQVCTCMFEESYRLEISGLQLRVLLSVMRHTLGYHRDSHELAVRFIARDIGSTFPRAAQALEKLIEANIIFVLEEAAAGHKGRVLSVNKDYGTWIRFHKYKSRGKPQAKVAEKDSIVPMEKESPKGKQSPFGTHQSVQLGNAQSPQLGNKGNINEYRLKKKEDPEASSSEAGSLKEEKSGDKISGSPRRYSAEFLPLEKETIFYRGDNFYVTCALKEKLTEKLSLRFSEDGLRAHFYNMDEYIRNQKAPRRDYESFIRNWLLREMRSSYSGVNRSYPNNYNEPFGSTENYQII